MHIKPKSIFFTVSLVFNVIFIALIILTSMSKSKTALFFFPVPQAGYTAAATIAAFPTSSPLVFSPIEISLKPMQKVFLQYSVFFDKKQNNILINALYDPDIISVAHTGPGIVITARNEGETLMQFVTGEGILNLALITVTE